MKPATEACRRLFIAVDVDERIKSQLWRSCRDWREGDLSLRWTARDQLHLTLAFLGDQPQEVIPQLARQLALRLQDVERLSLALDQLTAFPARRPHVLVAQGPASAQLQTVYDAVMQAVADCDLKREMRKRRFLPHVTLARCRQRPFPALQRKIDLQLPVDVVTLYQSDLTPHKAIHTALHRFLL